MVVHHTFDPHIKLTWGGTLGFGTAGGGALEQWSNSLRFRQDDGPDITPAELASLATGALTPLGAWLTRQTSWIGEAARLSYCKAVFVTANGKQRDTNTAVADLTTETRGYRASACPWYQTYAITMRTELSRGRAHAGRIYPPVSGNGPEAGSPYVAAQTAVDMTTSAATLINDLNALVRSQFTGRSPGQAVLGVWAVVMSPGDPGGRAPISQIIRTVECDRVPDVMHSRTNRVPRLVPGPITITHT